MGKNQMSELTLEKLKTLTDKEKRYFRTMWSKSGVLFITAKPGVAKSAIARSIADKMDFEYIDLRLSMADETDFKFPYLIDEDGKKVSDYAIPKWASDSNKKPTIIHFEELNRAPLFVRNAALQILLERQIGDFKFNDNVLMMSSGNLGEDDDTDVEEFDAALNNRLIHVNHNLNFAEWVEGFAGENVHKIVLDFLSNHKDYIYKPGKENGDKAYATPRSWTFLSDYIISNFGKDSTMDDFMDDLRWIAPSTIGSASATKFLRYCDDLIKININHVLDKWDTIKHQFEDGTFNRDKKSELINSLKQLNIEDLKPKQIKNVSAFLKSVDDDELTGYLLALVDSIPDIPEDDKNPINVLLSNFPELIETMMNINQPTTEQPK